MFPLADGNKSLLELRKLIFIAINITLDMRYRKLVRYFRS